MEPDRKKRSLTGEGESGDEANDSKRRLARVSIACGKRILRARQRRKTD